jgi:hypothetical protein
VVEVSNIPEPDSPSISFAETTITTTRKNSACKNRHKSIDMYHEAYQFAVASLNFRFFTGIDES